MRNHPLFGKKVVFKYPHKNTACFVFRTAFELSDYLREATLLEIQTGHRIDDCVWNSKKIDINPDIKTFLDNNPNIKFEIDMLIRNISVKEKEILQIKQEINHIIHQITNNF